MKGIKACLDKVNKDQRKAALRMSLKKLLFASFSSERLCLPELRNAVGTELFSAPFQNRILPYQLLYLL